jgi:hypothetical protein
MNYLSEGQIIGGRRKYFSMFYLEPSEYEYATNKLDRKDTM